MQHSNDSSRARRENMVESPITEQRPSKYKLILKYGGIFQLAKKIVGNDIVSAFRNEAIGQDEAADEPHGGDNDSENSTENEDN
ncbi:hypothetical protein Tco_0558256, partial [Tanacetum coccineum]